MIDLDFDIRLPVKSRTEAGVLAWTLNNLAEVYRQFDRFSNKEIALLEMDDTLRGFASPYPDGLPPPVSCRYKKTTVLFCNIRSFEAQTKGLKPTEKLFLLNGFFERAALAARLLDGYVDKITGDKIMMHWGAFREEDPSANEARTDMINALLAALAARAALYDWNRERGGPPLRFSFGIGTGRACFPRFDLNGMFEVGLTGPAVQTVWQCEAHTKTEAVDILMTEPVWRAVSRFFVTEEAPPGTINGKPARLFILVNVRDKRSSKRLYTALSRMSGLDLDTALSAAGPRGPKTLDEVRAAFDAPPLVPTPPN